MCVADDARRLQRKRELRVAERVSSETGVLGTSHVLATMAMRRTRNATAALLTAVYIGHDMAKDANNSLHDVHIKKGMYDALKPMIVLGARTSVGKENGESTRGQVPTFAFIGSRPKRADADCCCKTLIKWLQCTHILGLRSVHVRTAKARRLVQSLSALLTHTTRGNRVWGHGRVAVRWQKVLKLIYVFNGFSRQASTHVMVLLSTTRQDEVRMSCRARVDPI
jgi:hypothetical protein